MTRMTTSVCIYRQDRCCLELYASCLTPMALESRIEACRRIRTHPTKYDRAFTSLAKRRKSFRPLSQLPIANRCIYTYCSRKNGRFDGARTSEYSRNFTHYASIMPSAAKHVLFPLLCRHNLRKPNSVLYT